MSKLMRKTTFDFDRDVTSISLYRWGHGMIMPTARTVFGDRHGDIADRAKGSRRVAFARLGPISFAGQDSEGTPSVESAMSSGRRAAEEVLAEL